jgi:hypothetical protein
VIVQLRFKINLIDQEGVNVRERKHKTSGLTPRSFDQLMSNQDKSQDGLIDQPRNQISVEKLDILEISA